MNTVRSPEPRLTSEPLPLTGLATERGRQLIGGGVTVDPVDPVKPRVPVPILVPRAVPAAGGNTV